MKLITRTNGIVTQFWEDNDASWDFFLGGSSLDIHWMNSTDKYKNPKKFRDFNEAYYFLTERRKRLKTIKRREEDQWEYHIIEEDKA